MSLKKLYEKWTKCMEIWSIEKTGFEPEGKSKGKQCYAGFEPRNASLFLTEPSLKN